MTVSFEWKGRDDPEDGEKAKRWHHIVRSEGSSDCLAGLVGFACDLGVQRNKGRIGAEGGPDAIRGALTNMAWHGQDGLVRDYGNVMVDKSLSPSLREAQNLLGEKVTQALYAHQKAVVLGGGHETAVGSFKGLLGYLDDHPGKTVGIINLDAHLDLRKPGGDGISSGTPFFQIHELLEERGQVMKYLCLGVAEISNTQALFDRSNEWGVQYMLDRELRPHLLSSVYEKIDHFLEGCDVLYLSVDLDVLPHWQMPAVSAPAPYGVGLDVLVDIIDYLSRHNIEWPLTDIVEFNPNYDHDEAGAKVAARFCDHVIRAMTQELAK